MSFLPHTLHLVLLQCDIYLGRPRVLEDHIIKAESGKKFCPASNLITSHLSLKACTSQHEYAEVHFVQTAFTYSPIALQSVSVKRNTHNSRIDCNELTCNIYCITKRKYNIKLKNYHCLLSIFTKQFWFHNIGYVFKVRALIYT